LTAAEELAQTGECNADEIYSVAHELESHVTSFAARVEQRRQRLDLAVLFYSQEKEVSPRYLLYNSCSRVRNESGVRIITVLTYSNYANALTRLCFYSRLLYHIIA